MTQTRLAVFGAALTLMALTPTSARASSLTLFLDCSVTSATTCGLPTGSFGTITLSNNVGNPAWLDLTVNLTFADPTKNFLSKLFLNYTPALNGYAFTTTDSETVVATGTNAEAASTGYTVAFDIKFTDNDSVAGNPWTTVLKLQKASNPDIVLNVADFDAKDAGGTLFALVNHSGTGSQIGATTDALVTTTIAAVPEPATLTLLGAGLTVLGVLGRRRTR